MKKESLIGRLYTPIDNSYEVNLTNSYVDKEYLAGTVFSKGKITTIVSEPFSIPIYSKMSGKEHTHIMITVSYRGNTFITMFHIGGLIKEKKETDNENT